MPFSYFSYFFSFPDQVKLANQEQDLVVLLKRLPLLDKEINIIRERAEQLRDGKLVSRGEALLPLMLASFIFDALTLTGKMLICVLDLSF